MVELALVSPVFLMVLLGIVVLGVGVFYQQQISNGGREAARYAVLHSATSQCPTVSNRPPDASLLPAPNSYYECDAPANGWPLMRSSMETKLFGMSDTNVRMTACWSGFWTKDTSGGWGTYDQLAVDPVTGMANDFRECTVPVYGWCPDQSGDSTLHTINPRTGLDPSCPPGASPKVKVDCSKNFPKTSAANDMASSFAASDSKNANQVTVVSCYDWAPPAAGFLLIPEHVSLLAVVTEAMEYQQ
jgi:hypothetical protein